MERSEVRQSTINAFKAERRTLMEQFSARQRKKQEQANARSAGVLVQLAESGIDLRPYLTKNKDLSGSRLAETHRIRDELLTRVLPKPDHLDERIPKNRVPAEAARVRPDAADTESSEDASPYDMQYLQSTDTRQVRCVAMGEGNGWFTNGTEASAEVWWHFWYTPAGAGTTTPHAVSVFWYAQGFSIVRADDGWPESKEAEIRHSVSLRVLGPPNNEQSLEGKSWGKLDDNIDETISEGGHLWDHQFRPYLVNGEANDIAVVVSLYARAKGDGSYAEFDFASRPYFFVACPYITIYPG